MTEDVASLSEAPVRAEESCLVAAYQAAAARHGASLEIALGGLPPRISGGITELPLELQVAEALQRDLLQLGATARLCSDRHMEDGSAYVYLSNNSFRGQEKDGTEPSRCLATSSRASRACNLYGCPFKIEAASALAPILKRVGTGSHARWEWMLYYRATIPCLPAVPTWTCDTKAEAQWHRAAHVWIFVAAAMLRMDPRAIVTLLHAAPTRFGYGDATAWSLEEMRDLERAWNEVAPTRAQERTC